MAQTRHKRPLCIDLFCGLGGWTEGFLAEGYDCIGFDIERHDYGTGGYPAQLVLQDVLTLDGRQFRDATVIVASPPCQKYSYMAMPWTRAKQLRDWYREDPARIQELNALFDASFRIAREAGVPLIVENVRGACDWVTQPVKWHHGSFYLWGDVPALMPMTKGMKNHGGSWFAVANNTVSGHSQNPDGRKVPVRAYMRDGYAHTRHLTSAKEHENCHLSKVGFNVAAAQVYREEFKMGGGWWHDTTNNIVRRCESRSDSRRAASAHIAKIPFPLARHIARCFKPVQEEVLCFD